MMDAALVLYVCLVADMHRCQPTQIAAFETVAECRASSQVVAEAWWPQHPGWVWLRKQCVAETPVE